MAVSVDSIVMEAGCCHLQHHPRRLPHCSRCKTLAINGVSGTLTRGRKGDTNQARSLWSVLGWRYRRNAGAFLPCEPKSKAALYGVSGVFEAVLLMASSRGGKRVSIVSDILKVGSLVYC